MTAPDPVGRVALLGFCLWLTKHGVLPEVEPEQYESLVDRYLRSLQ